MLDLVRVAAISMPTALPPDQRSRQPVARAGLEKCQDGTISQGSAPRPGNLRYASPVSQVSCPGGASMLCSGWHFFGDSLQ